MNLKELYERAKRKLLLDESIGLPNRDLFAKFFEFEEHKLKRRNGLAELDAGCFKTLYTYILMFRNVERWFGGKPWSAIEKTDIERVYNGLEDATILNQKGQPFKDRKSYYNKVFKSKPFQMAGKADLAREVIEYSAPESKEVRFVTEDTFRSIVSVVAKPKHLLLLWLAWDVGENIRALLQLERKDLVLQLNRFTGEREYLVHLPQSKIKRTRQSRSEPTLYAETARYSDIVLATLGAEQRLFPFEYSQACKLLRAAAKRAGALSEPNRQAIHWKDLRSGMACYLLKSGWSRDEVNARLGHTPHSSAIDKYINYLALDRQQSKQKLYTGRVEALQHELAQAQQSARVSGERSLRQEIENQELKADLGDIRAILKELRAKVEHVRALTKNAA